MMSDENRQTMHCLSKDTLIDMIHDLGTKYAQVHREGWEQGKRECVEKIGSEICDCCWGGEAQEASDHLCETIAAMEYKDSDLCK